MSSFQPSPFVPSSPSVGHLPELPIVNPKPNIKVEQQAELIEEQATTIKALTKQLETDSQAYLDLISTLETWLGDSDKNLQEARTQATEIARERDTLQVKLDALHNELAEAKREVISVRGSIDEEKQSLKQQLDEERQARERARQHLNSKIEELQKVRSAKPGMPDLTRLLR